MSVEGVGAAEWRRIDRTLLSIQYLRAGAAICVLFAHGHPDPPQIVMTLLSRAVDLFFLMSGFIVVMITSENTRPLEFLRERVERIVPLYWLLTVACFLLLYSGILAPELDPGVLASKLARADWRFLANALSFIPAHRPLSTYVHPVIPQGWTLNFEMMFYASFALALFLPRRWTVPAITLLYAIMVGVGAMWGSRSRRTNLDVTGHLRVRDGHVDRNSLEKRLGFPNPVGVLFGCIGAADRHRYDFGRLALAPGPHRVPAVRNRRVPAGACARSQGRRAEGVAAWAPCGGCQLLHLPVSLHPHPAAQPGQPILPRQPRGIRDGRSGWRTAPRICCSLPG